MNMNKKRVSCFFVFIFVCSCYSFSQEKKYFDANGKSAAEEYAYYYRIKVGENQYKAYYKSNNNLYFEGTIISCSDIDENLNKYKGVCKWYYKNGHLKKLRTFNDNGELNGISYDYYENGDIKLKLESHLPF
ncbi:MAG: hypothetical protein Fur0023_21100 [Bacteroidia bacterium]